MKLSKTAVVVALSGVTTLVGCNQQEKKLETDQDKYSYAIGYQFTKNLKAQGVDFDPVALAMAAKDVADGKESKVRDDEMQSVMQKMYEERNKKASVEGEANKKKSLEFLEANKAKEGVKVTASGLQYKVLSEGSGVKPKATDVVSVHYRGTLIDGTEFDSSYKRNQPAEFPLNGVIPGWTEALQLMAKGAKYELYIPSELAYGEQGRPSIPPNSALIFEVELLDVKGEPGQAEPQAQPKKKSKGQ